MRRRISILAAVVLVPVLGAVDYVTGHELNFFVFYFVPVALVAWNAGRASGLAAALCCAVVWYGVDVVGDHPYSHPASGVWNAGIRFSAFAVVALTMARIRSAQEELSAVNGRLNEAVRELERSMARIAALRNDIQLVCAWTKRINSEGRWMQFEEFLKRNFQIRVSHGISEEGAAQFRAEMERGEPGNPASQGTGYAARE